MSSFQFLSTIFENEIATCPHCAARQYLKNSHCVRCHRSLGVDYVRFEINDPLNAGDNHHQNIARSIGGLLRSLRMRRHLCQAELARMAAGLNRSYLSRAECGRVLLPLSKLLPLLRALGLTAVILRFDGPAPVNVRINLP